jgi:hypothetical protein
MTGCNDYPVDEDGLLITDRSECYVSSFNLLGTDYRTVLVTQPSMSNGLVDTLACTIDAVVLFGTDLKNVYPQFTAVTDAKIDPKVDGLTDLSDLANPKQYTVISGNRKVRKTYTVRLTLQQP